MAAAPPHPPPYPPLDAGPPLLRPNPGLTYPPPPTAPGEGEALNDAAGGAVAARRLGGGGDGARVETHRALPWPPDPGRAAEEEAEEVADGCRSGWCWCCEG